MQATLQAYTLALENATLRAEKDTVQARKLFAEASAEPRNNWNTRYGKPCALLRPLASGARTTRLPPKLNLLTR